MNIISKILLASEVFLKLAKSRLNLAIDKYPHLKEDIEKLSELDPSGNDKYLMWMANQLNKGGDINVIIDNIKLFHNHSKKLSKKDINQYSLEELIKTFEMQDFQSSSNKRKQIKEDAVKIYEDDSIVTYRIDSKGACDLYGANTKWCITSKRDHEHYDTYFDYSFNNAIFYFILRKNPLGDLFDKVAIIYKANPHKPPEILEIRDSYDNEISIEDIKANIGIDETEKNLAAINNDLKNFILTKNDLDNITNGVNDIPDNIKDLEKFIVKYTGSKFYIMNKLKDDSLFKLLHSESKNIVAFAMIILILRGHSEVIKYIDKVTPIRVANILIAHNLEKYFPIIINLLSNNHILTLLNAKDNTNTEDAYYFDKIIYYTINSLVKLKKLNDYVNEDNILDIFTDYTNLISKHNVHEYIDFLNSIDKNKYNYLLKSVNKTDLSYLIYALREMGVLHDIIDESNVSIIVESYFNIDKEFENHDYGTRRWTDKVRSKTIEFIKTLDPRYYPILISDSDPKVVSYTKQALLQLGIYDQYKKYNLYED